ncbi:hypothetical protein OF83DRAFT_256230 [Amylostereum chailletii]|nr:hypothetical protein OF83DRAFT_256230 [Amylostereum chailletii]
MSVALLVRLRKNQEPRDDFESFLWVLLYNVLRYRPTCVKGLRLQELVHRIFDDVDVSKKGGDGKLAFFHSRKFVKKEVRESDLPIPLKNILEALRDLFRPLYLICGEDRAYLSADERTALVKAETLTSNSKAIGKIFKDNLTTREQWPENDKAEDQLPHAN